MQIGSREITVTQTDQTNNEVKEEEKESITWKPGFKSASESVLGWLRHWLDEQIMWPYTSIDSKQEDKETCFSCKWKHWHTLTILRLLSTAFVCIPWGQIGKRETRTPAFNISQPCPPPLASQASKWISSGLTQQMLITISNREWTA